MDGNKLLAGFDGYPLDVAAARAYVMGVVDFADSAKTLPGSKGASYACFDVPNGATAGQLGDVVKAWLQKNPEHRHFNGPSLVSAALATVYPCPKGR
jgi:hypothetical protein